MLPESTFHHLWRHSVPVQFPISDAYLTGLVITTKQNSSETLYILLDTLELPFTLGPRLQKLFMVKKLWTAQEIEIYVRNFLNVDETLEQFLLKHTRILKLHSENSVKIVYARK
uniref:Sister chromatid cohesion protein DCC1 n=1 Tax=Lygus hesperus TaxID=30085 RepID=A0A0A9WBQ7_LYGHE